MKKQLIASLAVCVMSLPLVAQASLFKFSYLFGDGTDVAGTLEGTAAGVYVTGVSNINFSINGNAQPSPGLAGFWASLGAPPEPSVVSFDASLNDFWFIDPAAIDLSGNVTSNGAYGFALIGTTTSGLGQRLGTDKAWVLDLSNSVGSGVIAQNKSWSLRSVPEPTSISLVAVALGGLLLTSRRRKV